MNGWFWPQRSGGSGYAHKICTRCGALIHREEPRCLRCGARAPSRGMQALRRSLGGLLPSQQPAVRLLIAANALVMLFVLLRFGPGQLLQPETRMLTAMGALRPDLVFRGQLWRLVTYGYLHIGLLHIGFNLFALSQVGPVLEERIGSQRFFVLYTLTLLGGSLAGVALRGPMPIAIAGASGALFGLIGFGAALGHFSGGFDGSRQRDFFLRWALYGFVFGFLVGADNIAHGGGFVTGLALGWLLEREERRSFGRGAVWNLAAGLCLLLTVGAYVWMIAAALLGS